MTMTRDRANPKPVILALTAAGLLLLILGVAHRGVRVLVAAPVSPVPIAKGALDGFPWKLGDWTGEVVPLDEDIERGTDTDALLSRRYVRRGGSESISFYVGCGVHVSRVMAHRPEHCYRRAGWTLVDCRATELPLNDGTKLPCNILRFARDRPQPAEVTVLHYWVADGRRHGQVSPLSSNLWAILGAVDYAAQVQISASTAPSSPEIAAKLVAEFAADSAAPMTRLFQDIKKDRRPGVSGGIPGEQ